MPEPTPPIALSKAYALTLWLIPRTATLPRAHRFALGDRLYTHSLDLLTALTQASFSRDKSLRLLLRLAKDLHLLDERGRMIDG